MDANEYLFPNELQISSTNLKKILLIGQCNSLEFKENWNRLIPNLDVSYVHHSFMSELPEIDNINDYQLSYIQIPLRSVIGDEIIIIKPNEFINYLNTYERAKERLMIILKYAMKYNICYSILTVVSNFIVPQSINSPSLNKIGTTHDLSWVISELNKDLAIFVSEYNNSIIGDTENIASTFGKRFFHDDFFSFTSHGTTASEWSSHENSPKWSYPETGRIEPVPNLIDLYGLKSDDFRRLLFNQLEWIYRVNNQIDVVKLVVFDLDNTLWRGQIAQHYEDGIEWPDYHLWVVGIWETVQILRRRGIPVSIISKNDEQLVRDRWKRVVPINWIQFEDFLSPKISWKSKSESMSELLEELSLTAKSVVFVDDNPVERAEVRTVHPEVRVIGGNPYETKRFLLWSSETNRFTLNNESKLREQSYRGIVSRNKLQKQMSRDDFLRDMKIKIIISNVKSSLHKDFSRVFELINKTNQFNTTGLKWTAEGLTKFLNEEGEIFSIQVSDRLSEYGVVGALVYSNGVIRQYVLSCRVLGLDIDVHALKFISNKILNDNKIIIGALIETLHNGPCRQIFLKSGFIQTNKIGIYALREISCVSDLSEINFT